MRETFMQLCIYFTLCLLAATLCINFVSASGIYGDIGSAQGGPDVDMTNITGTWLGLVETTSEGAKITEIGLWSIILTGVGVAGGLLYALTGNLSLVAAWLFSAVFWSSYLNLMSIVSIGGWIPIGLIIIASILMVPIFLGGLIGIFSGSG